MSCYFYRFFFLFALLFQSCFSAGLHPNDLKDGEFSDAETSSFDSEQSNSCSVVKPDFLESKMNAFVNEKPILQRCLSVPEGARLSAKDWRLCEEFIKNEAEKFFSRGITYIYSAPSHPCAIEKDIKTGAIYIHLKGRRGALIGEGGFKEVTKSILYGPKPELVARCQGDRSLDREAKVLSKLRGVTGIVQLKSYIKRLHNKSDLIIEYCNAGSLRGLSNGVLDIKENELPSVMRDLIIGLRSLHRVGYIHRDLHRGNILFTREDGVLRAVLTDFGLALKMKESLESRISVQDSVCAPEVLVSDTKTINRKKAEGYSLGALFYYMIFKEGPAWGNIIKQRDFYKVSRSKKIKMYRKIQTLYNKTISNTSKLTTVRKKLALLTFALLNPNPNKRMYLDKARVKIEKIYKQKKTFFLLQERCKKCCGR